MNPTSDIVYVANDVSGTISVIDGTNNTQIGTIRVGVNPISVAVNTETNMVYAANSDSETNMVSTPLILVIYDATRMKFP